MHPSILLPLVLCSVSVSLTAAEPAPLIHLPMDEGSGHFTDDVSPNRLEAELSHVRWVEGDFGRALLLSGEHSFVDLPPVPGLDGAEEFTLSLWAMWDGESGRYPNLLSSRNWSPGGMLLFVSGDTCAFRMGRPSSPDGGWAETSVPLLGTLPQKQWTHLAVTFARPHLKTYVNGTLVGERSWDHPVQVKGLRLGAWQGPVSHQGLIDDFRIEGRALSAEAVARLADDETRRGADYRVIEPKADATKADFTFENQHAKLSLDAQGRIVSLLDKKSGRELLARPQAMVSAVLQDGHRLTARHLSREGDDLVFSFSGDRGKVVLSLKTHEDFFDFAIRSLDLPETESLTFFALNAAATDYRGAMANMLSDDEVAVCLRGYDLPVEMELERDVLRLRSTAEHGLTGWRGGLAAGSKAAMPAMLRAMAEEAGVPTSNVAGPWALGAEANRGSYLFADLSHPATDDWIELARRGGFSTIHLHGWWKTLGHYEPRPAYFPNGLDDMKDTVDRIHGAGLRVGIHTLTACIDPRDSWITPVPRDELIPFASYTLARDFADGDTTLYVEEPPVALHDTVFTYSGNGNAIKIGGEIIQYSAISREPPYAFLDCTRGAFGTRTAAHSAGTQADYLQQRYIAFYPQPDSPLADELAARIAHVYNTLGLDMLYFDGSEGMRSRYGIDAMRHKIFRLLDGDPLIEASAHGAHNWWFHSRLGAWDHPVWGAKRFHDRHVASASSHRKADLLETQLGWWAPRVASAQARGHFLDEMEYFAAKNLGLDSAMAIQGVNVTRGPLPYGVERQITLLGWYERLRLARYFDDETIARIATPDEEFRLRQVPSGEWRFTPVSMSKHRLAPAAGESAELHLDNPHPEQPLSFRIEALQSAAPYDSPDGLPLAGEDDFPAFQTSTASPRVSLDLSETREDSRGGARHLRLRAENKGDSPVGAWARARLDFPGPAYRNLEKNTAFGLWVKGDGSGALLNFQIGSPREHRLAFSDHYLRLDFTGWRYVEMHLRERDVERMHEHQWPYGSSYTIFRNPVNTRHVSHLSLYLNDLPPGETTDITIGPIIALPTRPLVLREASLTLGEKAFVLPFDLASGEYAEIEPDGTCSRYHENGDLLERVLIADVSALPRLKPGANTLAFTSATEAPAARAEVTVQSFGTAFGERRADFQPSPHLEREYAMPHPVLSASAQPDAIEFAVRPGETARLEIEIVGEASHPTLEISGKSLTFPVDLQADQRLLCRDGRTWRVLDGDRTLVAEGELTASPPALAPGAHRVVFTSRSHQRPVVKLVKVY
ncbi:MAG: hypothetical protein GXX91_07520 [Verrucomicrobiaceae bacterium]|nr:hypothetical protein [Verrucomicrobiaceae bacterium]